MGKWWRKLSIDPSWFGMSVIKFNYRLLDWNLFPKLSGRISFFWKVASKTLSAFRGCITQKVNSGLETLFWNDRWLNGRAPRFLWPEVFSNYLHCHGTVRGLEYLLDKEPFKDNPNIILFRERFLHTDWGIRDKK